MPIDVVISPEREVAKAALQRLQAPSAFETEYFLDGGAQMIGIFLDETCLCYIVLEQLDRLSRHRYLTKTTTIGITMTVLISSTIR